MGDKVPLVIYVDGKRIVIGEGEIEGDHMLATITNSDVADKIAGTYNFDDYSIAEDVKPKRRNVFDQDKD